MQKLTHLYTFYNTNLTPNILYFTMSRHSNTFSISFEYLYSKYLPIYKYLYFKYLPIYTLLENCILAIIFSVGPRLRRYLALV